MSRRDRHKRPSAMHFSEPGGLGPRARADPRAAAASSCKLQDLPGCAEVLG